MTEPLREETLQTWQQLCGSASPGPWEAEGQGGISMSTGRRDYYYVRGPQPRVYAPLSREDAAFVATARTALPQLIAEVRLLREERANHVMVPREVADKALPLILHEVAERSDVRWWAEAGERTGAYSQGTADRWEAERQALEALAVALAAQKGEQAK